jgi:hypothetical protein
MIVADDGGGQVTVNGAASWSTYYNQPTAELYDVIVDNGFPYRLYGAQQDNTTISVPAWSSTNTLYPKEHWLNVGGCETGPVALDPDRPHVVYAGCYGGVMDRFDLESQQRRNVMMYPQLQLGMPANKLVHRFQWVSPMLVSQHDYRTLYHGSQYVNRSRDEGATWETISPDLTTNTPEHQVQSGGPINADVTGVEIYNVVFSIAESPFTPTEIWAGSDDGRIHITRDDGQSWQEITPPGMPSLGTVDEIEVSRHSPGVAYVAVHAYRLDDFRPYLFRTEDYGASWTNITAGIDPGHPTRTIREDHERAGLLFAGTEYGMYVSFDRGGTWQSFQQNLPETPITGMRVAHDDLIVSTQGRSFWIMDDISPLRETEQALAAGTYLHQPRDAYRVLNIGPAGMSEFNPEAPAPGVQFHYYCADAPTEDVTLEVVDMLGAVVETFSSDEAVVEAGDAQALPTEPGLNRVGWSLFYPAPELPEGAVVWGYTGGVKAPPGTYSLRMSVGGTLAGERSFDVLPDPRLPEVTLASFQEQFRIAIGVRDSINSITRAMEGLEAIRGQVLTVMERAEAAGQAGVLEALADTLNEKSTDITRELHQTDNQSGQDPIRFEPALDNQWLELYGRITGTDGYISGGAEGAPQEGTMERYRVLVEEWDVIRERYLLLLQNELQRFNDAVEGLGLPAVVLPGQRRIIS